MSVSNQLKQAIEAYGESVVHTHEEQDFDTVGMITPVSSNTTSSNEAVSLRSGFVDKAYYSYIAPLEEDEIYAIGDAIIAGEKSYTVSYAGVYPFRGERLYVHAFLKEAGEDGSNGQS